MRSILIILFAVFTINSTQAQEGEPKEKNFLQAISFKHNEVFKRFGAFASANVLYYHTNFGMGFDCFLIKNFSANIEVAVGNSYGLDDVDDSFDKLMNIKASTGLKFWPITKKTNNSIYPYFGVNLAYTSVHLVSESIQGSIVIETPIGLCYYRDGFQVAAHVGAFMEGKWGLKYLTARDIYPFMSFQVGYRF
jgi:hypothetical protein